MKCTFLFILVVVTQGYEIREKREASVPAPQLVQMTALDPLGFEIVWKLVDSNDVIGYKVSVWELPTSHILHYEVQDEHRKLIDSVRPPKFPPTDEIPENKPKIFLVPSDQSKFVFQGAKLHTTYETRVQARTRSGEGPYSSPMRITLGGLE